MQSSEFEPRTPPKKKKKSSQKTNLFLLNNYISAFSYVIVHVFCYVSESNFLLYHNREEKQSNFKVLDALIVSI